MGAKHARGKYLVFLSDAVVAEPGWLVEFFPSLSMLATPKQESTTPPLMLAPPPSSSSSPTPAASLKNTSPSHSSASRPISIFESKQKPKKERETKDNAKEKDSKKKETKKNKKSSDGGLVGMLACKLVYNQTQLLHSAGLGVSLSVKSRELPSSITNNKEKKKKEEESSWVWGGFSQGREKETYENEEAMEVLWHYRRLVGYSRMDDRASQRSKILGPSHHCFAVSRKLFMLMDGMNDRLELSTNRTEGGQKVSTTNSNSTSDVITLDPSLQVLDLSLRIKTQRNFDSEYAPTVNAVLLNDKEKEKESKEKKIIRDDGVEVMRKEDLGFFKKRKDSLATLWLESSPVRTSSDVDLVWDFYGGCTGWGLEAVSFITSLEDSVKVSFSSFKIFSLLHTFLIFFLLCFILFFSCLCSPFFWFALLCFVFPFFSSPFFLLCFALFFLACNY